MRWWLFVGLLVPALIGAGCNSRRSAGTNEGLLDNAVNVENTQSNMAPTNEETSQATLNSANTIASAKPSIDVAIGSIGLPASVNRGADFTISAAVINNGDTELTFAELIARARITLPTDTMNVQVGSGFVQNVGPHASQTVEFKGKIPAYSGPANVADIMISASPPAPATDPNPNNNWRTQSVVVH